MNTGRTEPHVYREGTLRRRVVDHMIGRRGEDVPIRELFRLMHPDLPEPTNREAQMRVGALMGSLRQAGWPVEVGIARRSYRLT